MRIDVPTLASNIHKIFFADSVELESCPIEQIICPPGTIVDTNARRGVEANIYVQVTNLGLKPVTNVRVIALLTDATTGLPKLPSDFWTTTFPTLSKACGKMGPSEWTLPDAWGPCQTIPIVNPDYPEVVRFKWTPPLTQADHSCILVIAESGSDPISRTTPELRPWVLVPGNHHVALRNLHIIDSPPSGGPPSGFAIVKVPDPLGKGTKITLSISRSALARRGLLSLYLPRDWKVRTHGLAIHASQASLSQQRALAVDAQRFNINSRVEYQMTADQAQLMNVSVPQGHTAHIAIRYEFGPMLSNTAIRFSIVETSAGTTLGGSTYIVRSRPPSRMQSARAGQAIRVGQ